jgi:hypothetical protein
MKKNESMFQALYMMLTWTRYIVAPRSCMLARLSSLSFPPPCHRPWVFNSWHFQFLSTSCLSISISLSWKISVCRTKSLIICLSIPEIRPSPKETFSHLYHEQSGTNQICTPLRELTSLILCKGNTPPSYPLSLYKKQIMNVSVATHISPSITHRHMNFSSSTIWFNRDPEYHGKFTFTLKI